MLFFFLLLSFQSLDNEIKVRQATCGPAVFFMCKLKDPFKIELFVFPLIIYNQEYLSIVVVKTIKKNGF